MNCYISDMLRSIVLCNVSEHNTWSAFVVYKDGAEENTISLVLDSITWKRKRWRKKSFKIFFTCVWGSWLTKVLHKILFVLLGEGDQQYLLKWVFALLGCYAALIDSYRRFGTACLTHL